MLRLDTGRGKPAATPNPRFVLRAPAERGSRKMPTDGLKFLRKRASTSSKSTKLLTAESAQSPGPRWSRTAGSHPEHSHAGSEAAHRSTHPPGTHENVHTTHPVLSPTPTPSAPHDQPKESFSMSETNNKVLQKEVDELQAEMLRAREGVMAIRREDVDIKKLRAMALKLLEEDMNDWPSSRSEQEATREQKLKQMKEAEVHNEKMKSDREYRLRFHYRQQMQGEALQNHKSEMSSEIARLNRLIEDRRREREEEDRCVKEMMVRLKETIKEAVTEIEKPSAAKSRHGTYASRHQNDPEDSQSYRFQTPLSSAGPDNEQRGSPEMMAVAKFTSSSVKTRQVATKLWSPDLPDSDAPRHAPASHSVARAQEIERFWERPSKYSTPCVYLRYDANDEEGRRCYIGQLVNGWRHGLGVLKYTDQSKYAGTWKNDHPCGYGVERYTDGSVYTGGFSNDLRHGYGEFARSDDISYCGQFEDGEMHGVICIREVRADGGIRETGARAERGQVFREPDWENLSDDDPRKAIAASMRQLMDVLLTKVSEATTRARNMSQDAHDLALEVSSDAGVLSKHDYAPIT